MSWHEQLILEAAGAGDGTPRLIPIGTATAPNGAVLAGYVWGTGRVRATVHPGWLRVWRESGRVGGMVRLDPRRLDALKVVCRDWTRRRDDRAAFWSSSAGYPPGTGGAHYYQAPGRDSERQRIGRELLGEFREGETLRGKNELRPLPSPRQLTPGVQAIAEIWRRGERFGPLEGSLVGLRYQVDGRFEADATRRELRLRRKDGEQRPQRNRIERSPRANDHEMSVEPGEEGFVDALADLFR